MDGSATDSPLGSTALGLDPESSGGRHGDGQATEKLHCLTERNDPWNIRSARIGGEEKHFSRWKPGSIITFTVFTDSFPSRGWAKFAQHALLEAANDWNEKHVGLQFRLADPGVRAVFALKYYRAPSWFLADAFAPDSKSRILYLFHTPLKRENRQHLSNLFRHELGHIIGLRHEDAATRGEHIPSVELTPANSNSIMNYFTTFSHLAQLSIQESDVEAVRKLCSIDQDVYDGFDVITVDPETVDRASFDSSDRLSSINSEILSTFDNLPDVEPEYADIGQDEDEDGASTSDHNTQLPGQCSKDHTAAVLCEQPRSNMEVPHQEPVKATNSVEKDAHQRNEDDSGFLRVPQDRSTSSPGFKEAVDDGVADPILAEDQVDGKREKDENRTTHNYAVNLDLEDALTPDPGTEGMFLVEDNPFAFSPGQLSKMFSPKSLGAFCALGGLAGLERGLRTNRRAGLSVDESKLEGSVAFEEAAAQGTSKHGPSEERAPGPEPDRSREFTRTPGEHDDTHEDRKRVFGVNRLPDRHQKPVTRIAWELYRSKRVLILLTVVGLGLLVWGLRWAFSGGKPNDQSAVVWAEGVVVLLYVFGFVTVGVCCEKIAQGWKVLVKSKANDRTVTVIRSRKIHEISAYEVLVGDVVCISSGDFIPVDGILIEGQGLTCDESWWTGESDPVKKTSGDEVFSVLHTRDEATIPTRTLHRPDPFLISGARVREGSGTFLATGVGINSMNGKIEMCLNPAYEEEEGHQTKRNIERACRASQLGIVLGLLLLIVHAVKLGVSLRHDVLLPEEKGAAILGLLASAVALATLFALSDVGSFLTAWALRMMLRDNILVRRTSAWEKAGNITTICTGLTAVLTQNKTRVVCGVFGRLNRFGFPQAGVHIDSVETGIAEDFLYFDSCAGATFLSQEMRDILAASAVVNSTALQGKVNGRRDYIGSSTETALLRFFHKNGGFPALSEHRAQTLIVRQTPFTADRKFMSTTALCSDGQFRVYVKGGGEIVLGRCTRVISNPGWGSLSSVEMTDDDRQLFQRTVEIYGQHGLRPMALAYRDDRRLSVPDEGHEDLTLLAILGIRDPLRHDINISVNECLRAGINISIITGQNVETARSVALELGIWKADSIAMEGRKFRTMSESRQRHVAPSLAILARASPLDKRLLVNSLRRRGQVVAVTGGGIDDLPAFWAADVSFAKGISGTDSACSAASVIMMDDSFHTIKHLIRWGISTRDVFRTFFQFELTILATTTLSVFIMDIASGPKDGPVTTSAQLLWIAVIASLAAVALAIKAPTQRILNQKPEQVSSPIISTTIAKLIVGMVACQLAVILLLYFGWFRLFDAPDTLEIEKANTRRNTVVLNTFFWLNFFNLFNCRRPDTETNILQAISRNKIFLLVTSLAAGGQVLIICMGGTAFKLVPLSARDWALSLAFGSLSVPFNMLIRLVPDHWIRGFARFVVGQVLWDRLCNRPRLPHVTVEDDDWV